MSKKTKPTSLPYQFPKEIEKIYYELLNNKKESLSEKALTHAEKSKLTILYEQLKSAYEGNRTEKLKIDLNENYLERKKIQIEKKESSTNYEEEYETKFIVDLKTDEESLKQDKQKLKQDEENWKTKKKDWVKDTIKRKKNLEEKEKNLKLDEEMTLSIDKEYQLPLNKKEGILKEKQKNMKGTKLLLEELRKEMLQEMTTCPEKLRTLFLNGKLFEIGREKIQLRINIRKPRNLLQRKITRHGLNMTVEEFLAKMDKNTKNKSD